MDKRYLPLSLTLLAVATLGASVPARGQQEPHTYTPPSFIIIPPPAGPNPYLMYVPVPQTGPSPVAPAQALVPPLVAPLPAVPIAPAAVPFPAGPSLAELGKSLRSYFTDDELDLLFEYMKESVVAAFKGEDVYLPPDLAFKLEVLLARMKKEGVHYLDNLMKQLEQDLKRSIEEKLGPPLPVPPAALPPTEPASVQPVRPASPGASGAGKLQSKKAARSG